MTFREIKDILDKFSKYKLDKQATCFIESQDRFYFIDKIVYFDDQDGLDEPIFNIEQ